MSQKFQLPHWRGHFLGRKKIKNLTWKHHPKPPKTQACHPSSHPQLSGHWPICRPSSKAGPRMEKQNNDNVKSLQYHQIHIFKPNQTWWLFENFNIIRSTELKFYFTIPKHCFEKQETVSGRGRKKWWHGLLRSIFFRQTKSGILLWVNWVNSGDQKRHSGKLLISFHFGQKPHGCFKKNGIPFRKKNKWSSQVMLRMPIYLLVFFCVGGGVV